MSCSYEIGIMANKNVARALDDFIESEKEDWSYWERKKLSDGSTMYKTEIRNHPTWFTAGKKFLARLNAFSYSKNKNDAFRCIIVNEESGSKEEHSNIPGQEYFADFGTLKEINYPESFEAESDNDVINKLVDKRQKCDSQDVAERLFTLLNDDSTPSYAGVFEDWCYSYIHGTKEFREGLDSAIATLTGHKLSELADMIA